MRRIYGCSLLSFVGILVSPVVYAPCHTRSQSMQMVAFSASLSIRLVGIAIASFSSGLGEMTYLQLSTVYGRASGGRLAGIAVGWFASGTGCAGLAGAGLWWVLRGLGVKEGLLICSVLPLCMALTYAILLPPPAESTTGASYAPVATSEEDENEVDGEIDPFDDTRIDPSRPELVRSLSERMQALTQKAVADPRLASRKVHLTTADKVALARPLFVKYMLPLFFVYLAEYTINTGVAPTLLYPPPTRAQSLFLSSIIKSLRDYYPSVWCSFCVAASLTWVREPGCGNWSTRRLCFARDRRSRYSACHPCRALYSRCLRSCSALCC